MRKSIDIYINSIASDNKQFIHEEGYTSIADYIITTADAESNYYEFFDDSETERNMGDPTEKQIQELKDYLNENYNYMPELSEDEVLNSIQAYEKAMSGCDVEYIITDEIKLKDTASLYLFENEEENIYSSAVGYEDGSVFVLTDWQNPTRPETQEDIENYDWVRVDGAPAIVFLGLPRVLE